MARPYFVGRRECFGKGSHDFSSREPTSVGKGGDIMWERACFSPSTFCVNFSEQKKKADTAAWFYTQKMSLKLSAL